MSDITRIIKEGKYADYPQQPHGGKLVDLVLKDKKLEAALKKAADLPKIMIDMEAVITVEMIATGVLSPNDGFMDEANYKSVLSKGRLTNGLIWPVPLSFAPTGDRNKLVVESLRSEEHTSELQSRPHL